MEAWWIWSKCILWNLQNNRNIFKNKKQKEPYLNIYYTHRLVPFSPLIREASFCHKHRQLAPILSDYGVFSHEHGISIMPTPHKLWEHCGRKVARDSKRQRLRILLWNSILSSGCGRTGPLHPWTHNSYRCLHKTSTRPVQLIVQLITGRGFMRSTSNELSEELLTGNEYLERETVFFRDVVLVRCPRSRGHS